MITVAIIEPGKRPFLKDVEGGLECFQGLVGGLVEFFTPLWGDAPALIVNEEGKYTCHPNRAVYANGRMARMGYLSQRRGSSGSIVEPGELYDILYGTIVAVSYDTDDEGESVARDITDEEFKLVCDAFEDPNSGWAAVCGLLFEREEA